MFNLFLKAFRHNWSAQTSKKVSFWAAIVAMIVNNFLFLYGMWLMLFDGKAQNKPIFPYYLTLTALAYIGWGAINFFLGGLRYIGTLIDNGTLEPMLGTPRSPLLLVAISDSSPSALGDLIQGVLTLVALYWLTDLSWVLRAGFSSVLVTIAFATVFIIAGTFAFFMNRGSSLSLFFIESTLSFSMYPMPKILEGNSRFLLYLTPAVLTATLPMAWIEQSGWQNFLIMTFVGILSLFVSILFFHFGLRRYRVANMIGAR